jgi:energy-coupling factor transporter ATP-binding protein EcfA2
MRLKSVWIGDYKNLKDFELTFDGESFLDIFVGKNGTGKSNFFEALVEIFRHIFDSRDALDVITFDYSVSYEIGGEVTDITWKDGVFSINGRERRTVGRTPVPDNVLIYYSGHNDKIRQTVDRYSDAFARRSRRWESDETRQFISIGPDYKELLLSVLLLQPAESITKRYLCEKLAIEVSANTAFLKIKAPSFRHVDVDVADPSTFLWGASGVSKEFVERLLGCIKGDYSLGSIYSRDSNEYELQIDLELFADHFAGVPSSVVFRSFDHLKALGMFGGLSIPLRLGTGQVAKVGDFSDGQFQSVYIFAVSELFKDRNCITLLDEPDSFLHPEWQFGFLKQVIDITGTEAARTNHVLLSSHSAATLISHERNRIALFDLKNGHANVYSVPKRVAVEKLSEKLIKYTEKEQLLSIINAIQIQTRPIFFTEGSIDPIILKEAWHRLYHDEMPFIPFYGFSCSYLKQLLTDDRIHNELGGLPVFGMFDFDKAYDHWNGLAGELIRGSLVDGLVKKLQGRNAYGIMLPVPVNETIRRQVVKNLGQNESFGGESLCEIEHLFYGDARTVEFFEEQPAPFGGTKIVVKSDAQKEKFATEVVPNLKDHYFEVFRPVFEFVKSTIAPDA